MKTNDIIERMFGCKDLIRSTHETLQALKKRIKDTCRCDGDEPCDCHHKKHNPQKQVNDDDIMID
jgi:hypothetical protein